MRIDGAIPYFNIGTLQAAARRASETVQPHQTGYYGPGVIVEISRQARDAYNQSQQAAEGINKITAAQELEGCQMCKSRKYVDESNDPSVSFQSPQHIGPNEAAGKVMAHEREHVFREQAKAEREDRKVVSQTVSVSTSICEECGRIYVSGGVTRTVTKNNEKTETPSVENNNTTGEKNA